ncbi:MAG: helix-turn-helix domain-containing protein [Chloroflexi bacterium]|nr:helix-turn-helix domain-containing protein [Chloroflexota bacterium]
MSNQKEPGLYLRALRQSYGKTQLDIELDAELGIGYLQRLERGKVQRPERATLLRIVNALGATFAERRTIFEHFGYTVPFSLPDDTETRQAIDTFLLEVAPDTIPPICWIVHTAC